MGMRCSSYMIRHVYAFPSPRAPYIYTLFILRPVQMARVSLRSYSRTLILRVFGQFRLNTGLTPGRTIGVRTRGDVILPVHVDGTLIRSNNRLDPPRCRKDSHRWDSSFFFWLVTASFCSMDTT